MADTLQLPDPVLTALVVRVRAQDRDGVSILLQQVLMTSLEPPEEAVKVGRRTDKKRRRHER
ncbi:MAG: hypothetical protein HYZ71_02580 [Deltaproteobacteria bacterium]|nr:hypothetical protein [Deltaproteobacteria bacterium]